MTSPSLDTKPYVEPDPLIGYRYRPNTRLSLPRPGGGEYVMAVNAGGIRSDREYALRKPPGVFRIIACGDSMAAGQFVSNTNRFSELLERRVPNLEVINLALEGSGTDQQLLLYEHVGLRYEHDLVLLLPFLQNIRRNMVGAREAIDPATGRTVMRPKPRFELRDGELRLVPPADVSQWSTAAGDAPPSRTASLKKWLNELPGSRVMKKLAYGVFPWEPFPEYANPDSEEWRLMAAIITRMKQLAGNRPLVVVPTFYAGYLQFRMARNYWTRFSSLTATPGISAIDLMPHFRRAGGDAGRCFQEPFDMHFSVDGHLVVAEALQAELVRLGFLDDARGR